MLLQDELCEAYADRCRSQESDALFAVFRLFEDMSLDQWNALAKKHDLSAWLTLPLGGDAEPHLRAMQKTLERLSYQSEHDPLTGLTNRRGFDRMLDLELERARRGHSALTLVLVDLDDFKRVNDSFGHNTGDKVLVRMAALLSRARRRYDLAARVGGEEFALVLPGAGQSRSVRLMEPILDELRAERFTAEDGSVFSITCSAGVATTKGVVDLTPHAFFELADKSLYKAKRSGKDRICTAPLPEAAAADRRALVQANEKRFLFGK